MKSSLFFVIICVIFFSNCKTKEVHVNNNIEPAFYYWKSSFSITQTQKNVLQNIGVKTLYLKFFDVAWNNETKTPVPIAQILVKDYEY